MQKLTAASIVEAEFSHNLKGSITTRTFFSSLLRRPWSHNVYLPDDYATTDQAYPVIYLLHGSGGDETSWHEGMEVLDGLIQAGVMPRVIAVAPAADRSWWVDTLEPFESATIHELVPYVGENYRTIKNRAGRTLAGFSMGGYGALRYALSYPEVFGAAALLSPALYYRQPPSESSARTSGAFGSPYDPSLWTRLNYPTALRSYKRSGLQVPMFIATGDGDWNEPEGWRYNVEYQSVLLYERLNKVAGSPAALRIARGGHDWRLWKPLFAEALCYMTTSLAPVCTDH